MKRTIACLILLGAFTVPAFAQKVTIDYASDFAFENVKTFAYVETEKSNASDDLMDRRIKDGIIARLKERGLEQVDADADIYVTYHVTTEENTVYSTTGYGYGGYWGGWSRYGGMGAATTTASTYTKGTLIVDAYEPAEKKMVWRGMGTVTVKDKPEKRAKQIEKILSEMGEKWDKILKKQGK